MRNWRPGRTKARVLRRRVLLAHPRLTVVEEDVRYHGRNFRYVYRPHGGVVHVVALTAKGDVVLVRQYRHPVRRILLELPAGAIDPGETPAAAARRELLEETGYASKRWIRLGAWYPSPASTTLKSNMFLALDAKRSRAPATEPDEFLRVELHPFDRIVRQLGSLVAVPLTFNLGILLASRHPASPRARPA